MLTILAAAAIAICPAHGHRQHCVHDGDTIWWEGEKMRLADIDTPELDGRCRRERALARAARDRLVVLLNARPITPRRVGNDRYGRTLVVIGDLGERLIAAGLATRWPQRRDWCG